MEKVKAGSVMSVANEGGVFLYGARGSARKTPPKEGRRAVAHFAARGVVEIVDAESSESIITTRTGTLLWVAPVEDGGRQEQHQDVLPEPEAGPQGDGGAWERHPALVGPLPFSPEQHVTVLEPGYERVVQWGSEWRMRTAGNKVVELYSARFGPDGEKDITREHALNNVIPCGSAGAIPVAAFKVVGMHMSTKVRCVRCESGWAWGRGDSKKMRVLVGPYEVAVCVGPFHGGPLVPHEVTAKLTGDKERAAITAYAERLEVERLAAQQSAVVPRQRDGNVAPAVSEEAGDNERQEVDYRGEAAPFVVGDLVVQNYYEQTQHATVQDIGLKHGRWEADLLWHRPDGDDLVKGRTVCDLVRVTREQVENAGRVKVSAPGHTGELVQSIVTRHAGKWRVLCSCEPGLELCEGSRRVAWSATEEEARALWDRHVGAVVEPVSEAQPAGPGRHVFTGLEQGSEIPEIGRAVQVPARFPTWLYAMVSKYTARGHRVAMPPENLLELGSEAVSRGKDGSNPARVYWRRRCLRYALNGE
ncbi:hypothetical protein [Streptomyces hydrogenans]|uniref:hypothetical protein n=1 Tax=Streptomyces hydrogenans TaxID=1873719 RepID=UPI0035DCA18F